jgi:hypothetical protein
VVFASPGIFNQLLQRGHVLTQRIEAMPCNEGLVPAQTHVLA